MDATTILAFVIILVVDIVFFLRERRYSVIYKGRNKLGMAVPIIALIIIGMSLFTKTLKTTDIIIIIPMIPLAFLGNKCGVSEEGILLNCYLTPWDRVNKFSIEKVNEKQYILQYDSGVGVRKVYFNAETGEQVDKYLSGMRKLRHRRVK